jgi:hypothetical protein
VVDDLVVVESSAEFPSRRVFRHTGRDVKQVTKSHVRDAVYMYSVN